MLVWLDMVMMKDTYQDVPEAIDIAYELKFTGVICKDLWVMNNYTAEQSLRNDPEFFSEIQTYLKKQKKYAEEKSLTLVIDELVSLSKKNITCTAPWDMVQIDVEGKVHLCCNEISK